MRRIAAINSGRTTMTRTTGPGEATFGGGLMDVMVERLDLRDAMAEMPDTASLLARARSRCVTCDHGAECAELLSRTAPVERAPSWCRNRALFDFAAD